MAVKPTRHKTNVLELLEPGDPVKGLNMGKCSAGTFHRIYEDRAGNTVLEYFCTRGKHAHGLIPERVRSVLNITKLKARHRAQKQTAA